MTFAKSDFVYRQTVPLNIVAAKGSTLYDDSGRRYIDLHASSGACMLGYRSDLVTRAAARAESLPSKPQFCESPTRVAVATTLLAVINECTGCTGSLAFDLGGAQAIEHAIKIASAARPGASTVLAFEGAYHGRSLAVSHLSCSPRYLQGSTPSQFKVVRLPVPALRAEILGTSVEVAQALCQTEVVAMLSDERYGVVGGSSLLHSFVFEPVLNVAGIVPIAPEYIRFIIKQVQALGGCIIADEIFTGFHKTNMFLATAEYASSIDIIVLSKGLTNGIVPLSVIWVNDQSAFATEITPGLHSSTYINGELALRIAHEVLAERANLTSSDTTAPNLKLRTLFDAVMCSDVEVEATLHHNMGRITVANTAIFNRIVDRLKVGGDFGVITAVTGLARNTLIFHPALTISDEEFDSATSAMCAAFRCG